MKLEIYPTNGIQLLRYENDNTGTGNYRYEFEQSDGTKTEQRGELRNEGREDEYIAVEGSYSWVGPDGVKNLVTYVADTNGYKPVVVEGPKIQEAAKSPMTRISSAIVPILLG